MRSFFISIRKNVGILARRLREQSLTTSFIWLYGRGLPMLTGKPILHLSRVTTQLYVGPQYRAKGLELLRQHGIHAVVNMRIEKDDAAFGLAPEHYCYLPTVDDTAPSREHFLQGIAFIDRIIHEGGKVYIHCGAGIGRAPSMAAAYLMATGLSLQDALALIKKVRPFIFITPPQMKALLELENHQFDR